MAKLPDNGPFIRFFILIMINYNNILKKYHLGKYRMVKVATFQMPLLSGITSRDGKLSSMNVELYNNYRLIWSINISIIDTDKSNSRKQFDKKQWHGASCIDLPRQNCAMLQEYAQ